MPAPQSQMDPEHRLALAYASAAVWPALETLWRLDARLGAVVATTTEPAIGAIRLAWWRDALARLDQAPAPAEPLLQAVSARLLPSLSGTDLAALAEGWGTIVDGDVAMLDDYGRGRGAVLFGLAARVLGGRAEDAAVMGAGWALVDLGFGQRDPAFRTAALAAADRALRGWDGTTGRALRPLGMLAALARRDIAAGPDAERRTGGAARIAVMLRHRMFGR